MKAIILFFLISLSAIAQESLSQDISPIIVNISDSPSLQYKGAAVKRKATVVDYRPLNSSSKEFFLSVNIVYYVNSSGAYGATVQNDILADGTLSSEQQLQLLDVYKPITITYTTQGKCADQTTGNIVPCFQADGVTPTANSISEIGYWQTFKLNQVSGVTSLSTNGTADVQYKIVAAIISKLDSRKKW